MNGCKKKKQNSRKMSNKLPKKNVKCQQQKIEGNPEIKKMA